MLKNYLGFRLTKETLTYEHLAFNALMSQITRKQNKAPITLRLSFGSLSLAI